MAERCIRGQATMWPSEFRDVVVFVGLLTPLMLAKRPGGGRVLLDVSCTAHGIDRTGGVVGSS